MIQSIGHSSDPKVDASIPSRHAKQPLKRPSAMTSRRCFLTQKELEKQGTSREELKSMRRADLEKRIKRVEGHGMKVVHFNLRNRKKRAQACKSGMPDGMLRFGSVEVREYGRALGESVSGSGPAVGLSWEIVEQKKYNHLYDHDNAILKRYRKRKKLNRVPPRDKATGIIEFVSEQDEYWLPPNKRHALLLMAGVKQPDIVQEVTDLNSLRSQRQESISDKDALAFAISIHRGIPEDVLLQRLSRPPPRPLQRRTPSSELRVAHSKNQTLKGLSLGTAVDIVVKFKARARKARERVARGVRKRRSSVASTQLRGIHKDQNHTQLEVDLMSLGEEYAQPSKGSGDQQALGRSMGRNNRRSSIVEVTAKSGDVYFFDDPALGGNGNTSWDVNDLIQKLIVTYDDNDIHNDVCVHSSGIETIGLNLSSQERYKRPQLPEQHEAPNLVQNSSYDEDSRSRLSNKSQRSYDNSGNKQDRLKCKSIVEMQDDDGYTYFYDDPSLGGTGKTAWDAKELEDSKNDVKEHLEIQDSADTQTPHSIVELHDDDGYVYFYDDPALGGSGRTAWTLEELQEDTKSS